MRSSNIELCRIAAILLVVLLHSAAWTQGDSQSLDTCFVPALFMKGFAIVGVNVFVFISGWFGITMKKRSVLNILYICLFYGVIRVASLFFLGQIELRNLFILSDTTWFVISYFGLVLFSPILNRFIDTSTKRELGITIIFLFAYQTWFGWFPALPYFDTFQGGYSFVSFIIIYLMAQYLRRYGGFAFVEQYCLVLYIAISIGLGFIAYYSVKYSIPITGYLFKYNNPLVLLSSVCFFFSFSSIKMPNSKIVNYLASSTLAVLLIHEPQPFHGYMKRSFGYLRDHFSGGEEILYWVLAIICVYVICILIDQVRILSYHLINNLFLNKTDG